MGLDPVAIASAAVTALYDTPAMVGLSYRLVLPTQHPTLGQQETYKQI